MLRQTLIYALIVYSVSVFSHPLEEEESGNEVANELEEEATGADISYLGDLVFGKPSNETGLRVANLDENASVNPEELGEYAEGDILFPGEARSGLISKTSQWPNGVVPYVLLGPFTPTDLDMIYRAMEEYHKNTCIKFRLRQITDTDYLSITNTRTGCWSSVGRTGGVQQLNLQSPGCLSKVGTPIHELLHALGCIHEQNRSERDDFVTIAWENIQTGKDNNFKKASADTTSAFGVSYDYDSVMHYSKMSFSKNRKPTIVAKSSSGSGMGQRDGFSKGDIQKINNMYCQSADYNPNKGGGILSFLFG